MFDSVVRRDGKDPAAFAMKLEILAVRGFGDVGQRARTRIVWDRFILGQRSCELWRHLDSVPTMRDIVDRCWVWESHSDMKRRLTSPSLGAKVPVTAVHSETLDRGGSDTRLYLIGLRALELR